MRRALLVLLAAVGLAQLTRFPALPALDGRSMSQVNTQTAGTRIGRATGRMAKGHPGESGVVPLRSGLDAFAARALLANAADSSLDVQYYIWHADLSGTMLAEALARAADRGVRVRLLPDDHGTAGLDPILAALDAHPRIEVRLFNPYRHRRFRYLGYLTKFRRLNRRMHNKSFTADNQATIIGGRNVGDEYFDAGDSEGMLFADLDVLAIGPVAGEVSRDFDRNWISESAYPVGLLLVASLAPAQAGHGSAPGGARAHLRLLRAWPTGAAYLADLARAGVTVSVLTNCARRHGRGGRARRLRPAPGATGGRRRDAVGIEARCGAAQTGGRRLGGSSSSSLHAKTLAVDRSRVFVGSFNFDPSSARLNTELGFVIPSPALAAGISDVFNHEVPARAYLVVADSAGSLAWRGRLGSRTVVHTEEPNTGFWLRLGVGFLSLLPIEWLL